MLSKFSLTTFEQLNEEELTRMRIYFCRQTWWQIKHYGKTHEIENLWFKQLVGIGHKLHLLYFLSLSHLSFYLKQKKFSSHTNLFLNVFRRFVDILIFIANIIFFEAKERWRDDEGWRRNHKIRTTLVPFCGSIPEAFVLSFYSTQMCVPRGIAN